MTSPRDSLIIPGLLGTGPDASSVQSALTPLTSPWRDTGQCEVSVCISLVTNTCRDVIPLPITIDSHKACSINDDSLLLRCHSFLSVYVTNVTYGRTAAKVEPPMSFLLNSLKNVYFRGLCFVMGTSPRTPSPRARTAMMMMSTPSCWSPGGRSVGGGMTA